MLPPCLAVRTEVACETMARVEAGLIGLRLIVAEARGLPDADLVAEREVFDGEDAAPWRD